MKNKIKIKLSDNRILEFLDINLKYKSLVLTDLNTL